MLSCPPRLILHKDEVDKVYSPDMAQKQRSSRAIVVPVDEQSTQSTDASKDDIEEGMLELDLNEEAPTTNIESSSRTGTSSNFLSPVIDPVVTIGKDIGKVGKDIGKAVINNVPTKIPTPTETLEHLTTGVDTIVAGVGETANTIADLPQTLSHNWHHLCPLLLSLVVLSLVCYIYPYFLKLPSVNEGLEGNRVFQYGYQIGINLGFLIPWVENFNFARSDKEFPVWGRILTVMVTLTSCKLFEFALCEGYITERKIFPIPYGPITSTICMLPVAFFVSFLLDRFALRKDERFSRKQFWRIVSLNTKLLVTIFAASGYTALFIALEGQFAQKVVAPLLAVIKFVCKIMFVIPLAYKLNDKKFVFYGLVVDMIFARAQTTTLPFVTDVTTLIVQIIPNLILLWRYYSGVDRLQIVWQAFFKYIRGDNSRLNVIKERLGTSSNLEATSSMFTAPVNVVHNIGMHLNALTDNFYPELFNKDNDAVQEEICDKSTGLETIREGSNEDFSCSSDDDDIESVEIETGDVEAADIEAGNIEAALDALPKRQVTTATERRMAFRRSRRRSQPDLTVVNDDDETEANVEDSWEQRQLYHIVDSTGSEAVNLIVLLQNLISVSLAGKLPISAHLTPAFVLTESQLDQAQIFGWMLVFVDFLSIACMAFVVRAIRRSRGRPLTMSGIISYLFRNCYWWFFLWFVATGVFQVAPQIEHFGVDTSFRFEYLNCPDNMAYPGCSNVTDTLLNATTGNPSY